MPALEPLRGLRVVADAAALDATRWPGADVTVLRFAPDDVFAIGADGVEVDDEHAIVEPEVGFAGVWLPVDGRRAPRRMAAAAGATRPRPGVRRAVPAKVWLPDDGEALLLTAAAYADELAGRSGEQLHRHPAGDPRLRAQVGYDVVIVGAGGHGLSTAYYLATRHGITQRRRR